MAPLVFPDNTVLCSFAAVNRLDLLNGWLRGRGRWSAAVAHEVDRSSETLADLALVRQEGWLGEPVEVDDEASIGRIETIRRVVFGGTAAKPLQHLGEAQTCFLLSEASEFIGAWWITDDEDAYEYAVRRRIPSYRTVDVMRHLVADGELTAVAAHSLMRLMADRDRGLFVPERASELQ